MKVALYVNDKFIDTITYDYPLIKVGDIIRYGMNICEIENIEHDFNANTVDVHLKILE